VSFWDWSELFSRGWFGSREQIAPQKAFPVQALLVFCPPRRDCRKSIRCKKRFPAQAPPVFCQS
jgi:hypothetical protein